MTVCLTLKKRMTSAESATGITLLVDTSRELSTRQGLVRRCWRNNGEFKKWQWQRQRQLQQQLHKSMIWLVNWRKIMVIVLYVRHAFWCNFLTQSVKRRREIFAFKILTTTRALSSRSFILCLYMNTIRAKQAKVHFAYFVQGDQHGIITKELS